MSPNPASPSTDSVDSAADATTTVARNVVVAEGITNPPIDDLLTRADSKYKLVLFAAKRARQINAYYSQLGEGLLDHVGPLVETGVQEKPLSIALREVNAGKLSCIDIDPDAEENDGDTSPSPETA